MMSSYPAPPFQVKCIDDDHSRKFLKKGQKYTVEKITDVDRTDPLFELAEDATKWGYCDWRFEVLEELEEQRSEATTVPTPTPPPPLPVPPEKDFDFHAYYYGKKR